MAHSEDDPFGWYQGMKSLHSMQGFSSRGTLTMAESAAGVWGEAQERPAERGDSGATLFEGEKHLTRYEKVALLGQGGMGKVWLGWDVLLERHVAIKEPHASGKAHLRREALLMAQLEHPGIARIHDIYQEDAQELFVMQLVPGASLGEILIARQPPFDVRQTTRHVRHILQVCEALSHAHARRIVHGDLSPRNIMVAPDGATHVIDWGLAHVLDARDEDRSSTETPTSPQGTPGFLAPEQQDGKRVTRATDVWSIGALLYTILEGAPPPSYEHSALSQTSRDSSYRALAAITSRCLERDPARRYADAEELARELEAWFEGRRVDAYSPSLRELATNTLRRYRAVVITNTILVGMLCGAIVLGLLQTRREAARAQHAERRALQESRRTEQLLIQARIDQAARALEQRDTYQSLEYITQGLAIADHAELRGLAMKLLAIALPQRVARTTLPPCQGRWHLTSLRDALCVGHDSQVTSWRDGVQRWRYDPLSLAHEVLLAKDTYHSPQLKQILQDASTHPPKPSLSWHVLWVRTNEENGHIHMVDNQRFEHELDPDTGELLRLDTRQGEFISPDDHVRIAWSARTSLGPTLAPSPCPSHTRDRMARPSHKHPNTTYYLCADGSLHRSALDREEVVQLAPPSAGFDLFMELSHTANGELIVSNRSGTIWMPGEEQKPLISPSAPDRIIELEGTPLVLVQGMEGELKVLNPGTMRWVSSLPSHAEALYVGRGGMVSLIRDGVLEQWRFATQPRIDHYDAQNGLTSVSWSSRGLFLGAVDGGGNAHLLEPIAGRALPFKALTTQVAKAIIPLHGTDSFYVGTIDMPYVYAIKPQNNAIEASQGPAIAAASRRIATLRDGTTYVLAYGTQIVRTSPERPDQPVPMPIPEPYLDVSMTSEQDALMCVGASTAWRFEVTSPETPEVLKFSGEEPITGVAIRADRSFALLHQQSVTLHHASGAKRGTLHLSQRPVDAQWHPSHPWLLLTFLDGSMEVYAIEDGGSGEEEMAVMLARHRTHRALVSSVSVEPGGRWAATASWDAAVEVHDLEPLMLSHEALRARLEELL